MQAQSSPFSLLTLGDTLTFNHDVSMAALLGSAAFALANWFAPILVAVSISTQ
ncbi:MAG: hypothetical protein AAGF01_10025 [Cyanobacteria bacterium P01_G01_bin.38]